MSDADRHVAVLIRSSNALRETALALAQTGRLSGTPGATQTIAQLAAIVDMHAEELDSVAQNIVRAEVQQAAADRAISGGGVSARAPRAALEV